MREVNIDKKTEILKLLLDEENKIPNIEGNTLLTLKAIEISKLELFSKEKN